MRKNQAIIHKPYTENYISKDTNPVNNRAVN